MDYSLAQEAQVIGAELIAKIHNHLNGVRIEYVFLSEVPKSKGKETMGRAKKKSGLDAFLAMNAGDEEPKPFFVVELAKPTWDILTVKQKKALVDHELSHFWIDDEGALKILAHDVEEFSGVIKRHGLWWPDVEHFATIAAKHVKQMDLPLPSEPDAVQQAKILKGGNGKAVDQEPVTNFRRESGVADLKNEVARRRGGASASK